MCLTELVRLPLCLLRMEMRVQAKCPVPVSEDPLNPLLSSRDTGRKIAVVLAAPADFPALVFPWSVVDWSQPGRPSAGVHWGGRGWRGPSAELVGCCGGRCVGARHTPPHDRRVRLMQMGLWGVMVVEMITSKA